ncbi:MAG: S-layer homology domain-containing protein, partial [Oscillospiraceae bacterium]
MKTKRKIAALLAIVMAFSLSTGALAAEWSDFTDISGHWAEPTLQKGFSDELITGYEDSTLRPDAPITGAQMISVLCRVLGATQAADISALNLPADAWYADAAGKALYLGLISPKAGSLDAPMTRQNAFGMLAKAFCLTPAAPDTSILNAYSDAKLLTPENKPAMAALISAKLVTGFAGSLNANGSITRAEFITILYRIAENYILPSALTPETASCVLKGDGALKDITLPCGVWFDCSAESISLENVSLPSLTLRSHKLANLSLIGSTSISSLAIAVGSGDVSLKDSSAKIGTLRLASCSDATVGANVESIEITGSGIPVTISGSHNSLIISGNNNIITLAPDAVFSHIKILGSGNKITTNTPAVTPTPAPTEAVKSESLPLEILPSEAEPAEAAPSEPLSSEDPALNTAPIEAALSETVTAEATPPV